jgi:hypothetical protein
MSNEFEMTEAEANLASNPEVAKGIADFMKDPSSGVTWEGRETRKANGFDPLDVKEEDGVEVEEENDGDIPDTGEDVDENGFDDDDEEDDDLYEEDEDDDEDEDEEDVEG